MKDLKQYLGTLHKNFRRSVFEIKAPRIIKSKRMAENLSSSRIFDAPSRMKRKIHRESLAGIMLQHCGLIVDAFDLHFFFFFLPHAWRCRFAFTPRYTVFPGRSQFEKQNISQSARLSRIFSRFFIRAKFVDRLKLHFKRNMKCSTKFWTRVVTIYKLLRIYPKFCLWIFPGTMIHLTRFFPPFLPFPHLWYSPLRNFCLFIANLSRYSSPTVIKIAALGRENYWIKLLSRNYEVTKLFERENTRNLE